MQLWVEQLGTRGKWTSQHPIANPFMQEEGEKDGHHGGGQGETLRSRTTKQQGFLPVSLPVHTCIHLVTNSQ